MLTFHFSSFHFYNEINLMEKKRKDSLLRAYVCMCMLCERVQQLIDAPFATISPTNLRYIKACQRCKQ